MGAVLWEDNEKGAENNLTNAHTRDIIAAFKQCLNHGVCMNDVRALLQQKVPDHNAEKLAKVKKKKPKNNQCPVPASRTQLQLRQWTDHQGNTHQYTVDDSGRGTCSKADAGVRPKLAVDSWALQQPRKGWATPGMWLKFGTPKLSPNFKPCGTVLNIRQA